MKRFSLAVAAALLVAMPIAAQNSHDWEGLTKVRSPHMDAVYLLPGADFRTYTKIKLDPTEVSFRRNWLRDYNDSAQLSARISDQEAQQMAARVQTGFEEIFANAYRQAGYQVVTEAGPDVLRLRTGVVDLYINAPDRMTPGMTRTYSVEAGEATLVIEARDSMTGALLGRAVDRRTIGDMPGLRTSVSNQADVEQLFNSWARTSTRGLEALKTHSPVTAPAR